MLTAAMSEPRRLTYWAKSTAKMAQPTVTRRDSPSVPPSFVAAGRTRWTTSTTVVEVSALSSAAVEFIDAAKMAAKTSPMSPVGRWARTKVREMLYVSLRGACGRGLATYSTATHGVGSI